MRTETQVSNGYEKQKQLFRKKILETSKTIVSGYEISNDKLQLPLTLQLAYLRAKNTINVNECLIAIERDDSQEMIDSLCEEAMRFHNWGRDVYWKAIGEFNQHNFEMAGRENISLIDIVGLYLTLQLSKEKTGEIEKKVDHGEIQARFPGLREVPGIEVYPLQLFELIAQEYRPEKHNKRFLGNIVELGYQGAVDTLAIRNCYEAMKRKTTLEERTLLYDGAKKSHQDRSLAFWEPMHKIRVWSYERAKARELSEKELGILESQKKITDEKLTKLEQRYLKLVDSESDMAETMAQIHDIAKRIVSSGKSQKKISRIDESDQGKLLELLIKTIGSGNKFW